MNISEHIKNYQMCSIVGATATGKTALALKTAQELLTTKKASRVHLLSADSRQVYKDLENLTGADLPREFMSLNEEKWSHPAWTNPEKNIYIHGVSIIKTNEEWSAAHFRKLFLQLIKNLSTQEFLIVVGGTGFYQQQINQPADTLEIRPNPQLRAKLESMNLQELQEKIKALDVSRLRNLNHSDLHNPRRLIRAIEIASFLKNKQLEQKTNKPKRKIPIFYLNIEPKVRRAKIEQRVEERFDKAKEEVTTQLKNGQFNKAAASCTGFQELRQFLAGEIDRDTCLKLWITSELQYAKRQDTWWKKRTDLCYI